jgi:hypothetical protein
MLLVYSKSARPRQPCSHLVLSAAAMASTAAVNGSRIDRIIRYGPAPLKTATISNLVPPSTSFSTFQCSAPKSHPGRCEPHASWRCGSTCFTVSVMPRNFTLSSMVGGMCTLSATWCPAAIWWSGAGVLDAPRWLHSRLSQAVPMNSSSRNKGLRPYMYGFLRDCVVNLKGVGLKLYLPFCIRGKVNEHVPYFLPWGLDDNRRGDVVRPVGFQRY